MLLQAATKKSLQGKSSVPARGRARTRRRILEEKNGCDVKVGKNLAQGEQCYMKKERGGKHEPAECVGGKKGFISDNNSFDVPGRQKYRGNDRAGSAELIK